MSTSARSSLSRAIALARAHGHELLLVLARRAEAVDARDRRHDHDVAAAQQRRRRRVAQAVDVLVARGVLLDVRVRRRQVRLGLVVVVVRDEVLDGVRPGRTRGTRCRAARRASCCGRSRASASRRAAITLAIVNVLPVAVAPSSVWYCRPSSTPADELGDRLRLIARRLVALAQSEDPHACSLGNRPALPTTGRPRPSSPG